jgi:hypothetical protein
MILRAPQSLLLLACLAFVAPSCAFSQKSAQLKNEKVSLTCAVKSGTCLIRWRDGTELGPIAANVEVDGDRRWTTTDFPRHQLQEGKSANELILRHTGLPGAPELTQHISLPTGSSFFLMDVEATSGQPIRTRHISPLVLAANGSAHFTHGEAPSVLFVPFDNDMWVHYNEPVDPAKDPDSYEVTAIYDNASRHGLVLGSITHDQWRTGILARKRSTMGIEELEVFGGATGHWTHDIEPHGLVSGTTVKSPQIMVGYFADWRDGLEVYGRENAHIKPPLPWKDGVPFGWNSWAAHAMSIDVKKYNAAADFIHTELEPRGFQNNHTTYVNWDAGWNALSEADLIAAARRIHAQGQKAGIYYTPFSYWSDDFSKPVEGTDGRYKYSDLLLRDSHGEPLPKVDGARPLDPTHPGTIERIDHQLAQFVAWGYDSVKLDFLNCGSIEGQHHDPKITTGVEAYNFGMKRIEDDLSPGKIGRPFFISLSIAPLFPAYGHGRRISCDAFGRIEDSEYLLNAVTFGWWTNGTLYQFNDPDHTVIAKDLDPYHSQSLPGSVQTLEEARSRVNASVIAGTMLLDSDDLSDPRAQARARELLTNHAVLEIARAGRSFKPAEGDSGIHAASVFLREEKDGSIYLAVFNYSEVKPSELNIEFTRLGLKANRKYRITDLWTGDRQEASNQLKLSLTAAQSRLLHFIPE